MVFLWIIAQKKTTVAKWEVTLRCFCRFEHWIHGTFWCFILTIDFVRHITGQYGVSHSGSCFVHHGRNTCRISLKLQGIQGNIEQTWAWLYSLKRRFIRLTSRIIFCTSLNRTCDDNNRSVFKEHVHSLAVYPQHLDDDLLQGWMYPWGSTAWFCNRESCIPGNLTPPPCIIY